MENDLKENFDIAEDQNEVPSNYAVVTDDISDMVTPCLVPLINSPPAFYGTGPVFPGPPSQNVGSTEGEAAAVASMSEEASSSNDNDSKSKASDYEPKLSSEADSKKNKFKKLLTAKSGLPVWDPLVSKDWDRAGVPGPLAATRIKRDISALFREPLPGIFVLPKENDFCLVQCIIVGPFDTPYEGGFFTFLVRFGHSYPLAPPRVRFTTTDGGKLRFNPNLYSNGKVCLSTLGTWTGPKWSPVNTLGSLLLSIQSLLNEKPYYNEPGFSKLSGGTDCDKYNTYLTHETLRVAVCCHMERVMKPNAVEPDDLINVAKTTFLEYYDGYVRTCKKNTKLDNTLEKDMFGSGELRLNFQRILERLCAIKKTLDEEEVDSKDGSSRESPLSSLSDDVDFRATPLVSSAPNACLSEANDFLYSDDEIEMFEASVLEDDLEEEEEDIEGDK